MWPPVWPHKALRTSMESRLVEEFVDFGDKYPRKPHKWLQDRAWDNPVVEAGAGADRPSPREGPP